MPVHTPGHDRAIAPTEHTEADGRQGQVPGFRAMMPDAGLPRFEDLLSIRVLERQPTVSLPLNTIRNQVTTTEWGVRPTVENPTSEHEEAVDWSEEWLDGRFNPNRQKFTNLLKLLTTDSISVDTMTSELVPSEPADDGTRYLAEMWHLDGITMSKELDQHGQIPEPPEPAYYQFAPRSALGATTSWGEIVERIGRGVGQGNFNVLQAYGRRRHDTVAFSRDEVAWLERNPQTATNYGFGKVQQVKHWAEILLNVDISNSRYFSDNQIPQGILRINAGSQTELDRARDYFRDTLRGKTDHVAPTLDGQSNEDIEWIPIQGTPEELQFLDSQQWYHKLVWFLFGLNEGEIGSSGDVNRSTASEHSRQVFRQTTRPLLDDLEDYFNQILQFHESFQLVNGEIEFYFQVEHEQMQELERERQRSDLDNMLATPNSVLRERGEEEVPWGDVPVEVIRQISRQHPEWALEQWGDIPEEELPDDSPFGDLDVLGRPSQKAQAQSSTSAPPSAESATPDLDGGRDDGSGGAGEGNGHWATRDAPEADGEIEEVFGLEDLARALVADTSTVIQRELEQAQENLADRWPEDADADETIVVDVDAVLDDVDVKQELTESAVEHSAAAMQQSATEEAERLEEELEGRYGLVEEVAQISLDFDLTDTVAFEVMRRRVARDMVSVEETVRQRVRNVVLEIAEHGDENGDKGVSAVTNTLDEQIPEISRERSRLVARTELPQASREGSQALAESTDVIGGKDWIPTGDAQTRPWHDAMADVDPIPVDESWTVPAGWQGDPDYQPSDYPRAAHTVGEDQPFNCRCVQRSVLREDMPDDVREFRGFEGVEFTMHVTDRQFEVWREHATVGEDFEAMLTRLDRERSRSQLARELCNGSKKQLYGWLEDAGVK